MSLLLESPQTTEASATLQAGKDEPAASASARAPSLPSAFSADSLEWEEWRGDWPFIHHAVAGSFAGVMEHITMYPIDTIKTRMQAFRGASASRSTKSCSTPSGDSAFTRRRCGGGAEQTVAASQPSGDAHPGCQGQRRYSTAAGWGVSHATGRPCGVLAARGPFQTAGRLYASKASTASPLRWAACAFRGRPAPSGGGRASPPAPPWAADASTAKDCLTPRASRRAIAGTLAASEGLTGRQGPCSGGLARGSRPTGAFGGVATASQAQSGLVGGPSRALAEGTGLVGGLRTVYLEGGLLGLYRGAGAVVAGCVPAHACYFMSYEFVKGRMWDRARRRQRHQHLHQQQQLQQTEAAVHAAEDAAVLETLAKAKTAGKGAVTFPHSTEVVEAPGELQGCFEGDGELGGSQLTHVELLACGMCATISHDLILTPVDVVKQRMQLGCFRSLTDCVTATLRREGPLAFVRSLPVSVLLNLPYGATLVYVNETLKNKLTTSQPSSFPSLPTYFFCAGISGGVAGFISNPLDVVKTRLQTQDCAIRESRGALGGVTKPGSCALAPCPPKYNSLLGTLRTIWLEEGFKGFWRVSIACEEGICQRDWRLCNKRKRDGMAELSIQAPS
ncbi:hypothetical protein Efla_001753 [Eimeria flavescens]